MEKNVTASKVTIGINAVYHADCFKSSLRGGDYMMRLVDLFCGCGGMSLGFQNAGFDIVGAFDCWKPAVDTYRKNFKHPIYEQDLSSKAVPSIKAIRPDIIVGGPPCQDFSAAGKRDITRGSADLTPTYCDIVTSTLPQYFVMENVPDITYKKNEAILSEIKTRFKAAGYGLTGKVLDASYCGVPQARKRYILVGCLGGKDDALLPYLLSELSDKQMSLREYFNSVGIPLDIDFYYAHPRNYKRQAVFSVDKPSATIRGNNGGVAPGYPGHKNDDVNVRDPRVRKLTAFERSMVQTFPADFIWVGKEKDIEQMIGNAVPVKLAEFVAKALLSHLKGGVFNG